MNRQRVFFIAGITAVMAAILSWTIELALLRYPFFAVFVGSTIFIMVQSAPFVETKLKRPNKYSYLMDYTILIGIISTIIVSTTTAVGVPGLFYFFVIFSSFLISSRIILFDQRLIICLIQIILFGVAIRASLYFSYPMYGQDLFHLGATEYILTEGVRIPPDLTYYHDYPIAHILGAVSSLLGGLSGKQGLFIAGGVVQVLSYCILYLISKELGFDNQLGLLTVLFATVSGAPIDMGSEIFAQTLAGGMFVFILWLLLRQSKGPRLILCLIVLSIVGFFTHHLIVALLVAITAVFSVVRIIKLDNHQLVFQSINPLSILQSGAVIILSVISVYYWIDRGYIMFQINRIITIFSFWSGSGSEVTADATSPPSVLFLDGFVPPVAQWAAPMLILVTVVTISGFIFLSDIKNPNHSLKTIRYILATIIIFAGFAGMYAIGGQGPLTRVFPSVTIICSILVAYILSVNRSQKSIHYSTIFITIFIIVCAATAGILNPAVAIPDRTDESFSPTGTHQDLAAIDFSEKYAESPVSDNYLATGSKWYGPTFASQSVDAVLHHQDRVNTDAYDDAVSDGESIIYRSSFESIYLIQPPTTAKYYSSGDVKIYGQFKRPIQSE